MLAGFVDLVDAPSVADAAVRVRIVLTAPRLGSDPAAAAGSGGGGGGGGGGSKTSKRTNASSLNKPPGGENGTPAASHSDPAWTSLSGNPGEAFSLGDFGHEFSLALPGEIAALQLQQPALEVVLLAIDPGSPRDEPRMCPVAKDLVPLDVRPLDFGNK